MVQLFYVVPDLYHFGQEGSHFVYARTVWTVSAVPSRPAVPGVVVWGTMPAMCFELVEL